MTEPSLTWALMAGVALAWPLHSAWSWPRRRDELGRGDPQVRRRVTMSAIARQWALAVVVAASWWWEGWDVAALRLTTMPEGWQWAVVGVAGLLGIGFARTSLAAAGDPEARAAVREAVDTALLALMPQTPVEQVRFAALSVTAGVCEEFLFRGVLWALVLPYVGAPAALGITSLAFGLAHLYQGPGGVLRTGVVGALLGGIAWGTGTLWVPVVLHAVVDVVQGRLLAAAAADA